LLEEPAELRPEEHAFVQVLGDRCAELRISAELARAFAGMVRHRHAGDWENWMTNAQGPGVARELSGFAAGSRQDEAAVRAALSLGWSNGPVEGQVNRLKVIHSYCLHCHRPPLGFEPDSRLLTTLVRAA